MTGAITAMTALGAAAGTLAPAAFALCSLGIAFRYGRRWLKSAAH